MGVKKGTFFTPEIHCVVILQEFQNNLEKVQ